MTTVLHILTALFLTVGGVYYIWIMQLNGYFFKRSIKALLTSPAFLLSLLLACIQVAINLLCENFALWSALIFSAMLSPFVFFGKKTPLKITFRVFRWALLCFLLLCVSQILIKEWCLTVFVLPIVLVSNMILYPLQMAINNYYLTRAKDKIKRTDSKVIIVTGSYAKTSTKNILNAFLNTKYKVACSVGNFNTPLGLAKFINNSEFDKSIIILEAGAKQKGDIAKICKIYPPNHAILTGVASQHLDTFLNLQNVISTKGEVLKFLPKDGFCVLNADDQNSKSYFESSHKKVISVGKTGKDFCYSNVTTSPKGTTFNISTPDGSDFFVETPLLGSVSAHNLTMAFALAVCLGCDEQSLCEVAKTLDYVPHRLQLIKNNGRYILDDSYNANEKGVEAFLEVLKSFDGTKAVISQGIIEMGFQTEVKNYLLGKKLAQIADYCALLGQNTPSLYKGLIEAGMAKEKIFICKTLAQAVASLNPYLGRESVIAFQNDLPDNINVVKGGLK